MEISGESDWATGLPRPSLPGYELIGPIGRGATGTVWAVRSADGIRLAAKVLSGDADQLDYEISVLESIRHEHVVRLVDVVLDTAVEPPGLGLVMELAEGGSLAETLTRRGVLTPGELVTVLCPVARALHDLHGLGLVHGDLSPGNILLTGDGKPLIGDLGMSHLAGHTGEESWATEAWAAPEVLGGAPATPASDVYSLGAIAWRALTGEPPEPAALRTDLSELAPEVPQQLRDLVNSALAHTDSARPLPREFALALWRCADPAPAPVQGSSARRAAAGAGQHPAEALTRRIRAAAEDAAAPSDLPDSGSRRQRRTAGRRTEVRRRPTARWAWAGLTCAVGLGAVAMLLGVPDRSHGETTAARSVLPPASARSSSATPSRPSPTTPAQPSSSASTAPGKDTPERLGNDPAAVVQSLADARAAAWRRVDQGRLAAALLPGSVADQRDRADLGRAAASGARYDGLSFRVRSAQVQQGNGATVHVTAVIDRPSYQVVTGTGRRTVPADAGQRTDVSVRWTDEGWRIADWRAASGPPVR